MPRLPEYPSASPDDSVLVYTVQDGRSRRALLPSAVFQRNSTNSEARERISDNTLMTPAKTAVLTDPLNNELQNFWGSWTENNAFTATPGSALVPVGSTGYPISLVAAASDIRTVGITAGSVGIFYPGVVGTPAIPGDTWRFGVVARRTATARFALVYFDTAGLTLWEISTGGWTRITDTESPFYSHRTTGFVASNFWHALPPGISDAPSISATHITLVNRTANGNDVYSISLGYNASPVRYSVHWGRREFQSPAAAITLSQVKTVLEGASGDNRLDASAIKNLPQPGGGAGVPDDNSVSTIKLQDNAVTNPKVLNGTLTLAKLDTTGAADGQVPKLINGSLAWANDSGIDTIGANVIQTAMIQDAQITNPKLADDAVDTSNYKDRSITGAKIGSTEIAERHFSSGSMPIGTLKTTGQTNGHVPTIVSGVATWAAPANPSWVSIAGAYAPTQATGTKTLFTGREFPDYSEFFIQGRGKCQSLTIPAIVFNSTSSSNRINLAVGADGYAQIYRSGISEITYVEVANTTHADHGFLGIWGR